MGREYAVGVMEQTFISIQDQSFVLLVIRNIIVESQVGLMAHWQPAPNHMTSACRQTIPVFSG